MNCLNTRRILAATPNEDLLEVKHHLAECASCRAFAARLTRDEQLLLSSIAVPVPEQLAERILLRAQIQSRRTDPWTQAKKFFALLLQPKPAFFTVAASLTLVIGLLVMQISTEHKANWSEVILAHALGETDTVNTAGSFSERDLSAALKVYGLATKNNLGKIRYLGHCPLPGGRGIHAIIDTPDFGQVTLILPPVGILASPGLAQREGYISQITHINQASIGIITQQPDKLAALTNRLHQQIVASL